MLLVKPPVVLRWLHFRHTTQLFITNHCANLAIGGRKACSIGSEQQMLVCITV